jgi:hypothetical protein
MNISARRIVRSLLLTAGLLARLFHFADLPDRFEPAGL